jgi:uncharacterized membrane protein YgdD (TMEM256/DUF423 family)
MRNPKTILTLAASLMAMAVVLGALGAHALQSQLNEVQLASFETGVRYQAWHCIAIIALYGLPANYLSTSAKRRISIFFLIGIVLFSFSIYLLNTRQLLGIEVAEKVLGPITPIGGLCLIAGWIMLAVALLRNKQESQ